MRPDYLSLVKDLENADKRTAKEQEQPAIGSGGNGPSDSDMSDRLSKIENDMATLKGSFDVFKITVTMLLAVTLGGFGLVLTLVWNLYGGLATKVDGLSAKLGDEFRAQRAEQSAQISTLANVITATKQQAPQVLLVPTPAPEKIPSLALNPKNPPSPFAPTNQ